MWEILMVKDGTAILPQNLKREENLNGLYTPQLIIPSPIEIWRERGTLTCGEKK
jgi:hypothetical protein